MLMSDSSSELVHSRCVAGSDGFRAAFSASFDESGRRRLLQTKGNEGHTELFVSPFRARYCSADRRQQDHRQKPSVDRQRQQADQQQRDRQTYAPVQARRSEPSGAKAGRPATASNADIEK